MKALICAVILIVMFAGCATVQPPSEIPDRMNNIRIGMTHQEVENLIGKPTSVTETDTSFGRLETCNYDKTSISVVYNHGKVLQVQSYHDSRTVSDTKSNHDHSKPNAGIHVNENMEVTGVDINSPAYKAGIKVNDIILAFDGTNVSDTATLRKLTAAVAFEDRKNVRIQRGSKILNLTIYYPPLR